MNNETISTLIEALRPLVQTSPADAAIVIWNYDPQVRELLAKALGYRAGMMKNGVYGLRIYNPRTRINTGTSIVVFSPDRQLTLLEHRRDNDQWGPLGGRMNFGESLYNCVLREATEECGLEVRDIQLVSTFSDPALFPFFEYPDGETSQGVGALVACIADPDAPLTRDEQEAHALRWVSVDEVLDMPMHPFHRAVMKAALTPPETWGRLD